jgi:DNA-binding transcriptional LysR family regulator
MELRQLEYFVAVAEELQSRAAADRAYLTQPAVSEQIGKLEADLGVRLFERTERHVSITEAGAALLDEGRRVLAQADTAELAARFARERAAARLRIGYVADAMPASVPRALVHLNGAAPRVDITLETGSAIRLLRRVREGQLDAIVVGLPTPTSGLCVTSLGRQGMVAAIAEGEAHATAPAVRLAALAPTRLATLPREFNPAFHDALLALCRAAGLKPALCEVAEPRVEAILLSVAAGAGCAILPAAVTDRYAIPGVSYVPLEDGDAAFETAVLTKPDAGNIATAAFLSALARFTVTPEPRDPHTGPGPRALQVAA